MTNSKDYARAAHLKRTYNLTVTQFEDMLCEQDACCAVCGLKFDCESGQNLTPHVDHCHNTGLVRGLVCKRCNTVLGHLEQVSVSKYINYLERYSNAHPSNEIGLYLLRKAS